MQIELLLYNGNNVILQPELFDGNDNGDKAISFAVIFHIAPQPVIYIAPVNYDGQAVNYEHCLVFSSFPHYQCSINNGALALAQNTNSLSQQRANMSAVQGLNARLSGLQKQGVNNQLALGNFQRSMQIVGDVAGGLGSLVTGNVGGALSAGVNAFATYASGGYYQQQAQIDKASIDAQLALTNQNIANSYKLAVANVKDAQIVPPTITGLSAGDTFILSVAKKIPFLIVKFKQAPAQEMLNIYNYFKNYGLQVNSFAVPNRTYRNGKARNKLNYVQLETVNIIGNIPESYINELQQIYKNGVTIWHCPEWQFLDYNFEANE